MANGMRAIFMVKHDAQLGYTERCAESFKNSYAALWEAFGAKEIANRHVYTMSLPLKLNPLSGMKHKGRAIARRRNWLEIGLSARQAMLQNRTSRAPPPIEGEAHEMLPYTADARAETKVANQLEAHLVNLLESSGDVIAEQQRARVLNHLHIHRN